MEIRATITAYEALEGLYFSSSYSIYNMGYSTWLLMLDNDSTKY